MSIFDICKNMGVAPEVAKFDTWPEVQMDAVPEHLRQDFMNLVDGMRDYCSGQYSARQIEELHSINRTKLTEFARRAMTTHADGRPWGQRALVLYLRQNGKSYVRTSDGDGVAGLLKQHFVKYPHMEQLVREACLAGQSPKEVWEAWTTALRQAEFGPDDYPFCFKSEGYNAILKYRLALYDTKFRPMTSANAGEEAAQRSDMNTEEVGREILVPYERVELDTHTTDAFFVLRMDDLDGEEKSLPLVRLLIIVLIDCFTRAVLGYYLTESTKENTTDVLAAIARSLKPEGDGQDTGLPVDSISLCEYRCFDSLAMDNSRVQISRNFQDVLIRDLQATVNTGLRKTPEMRAFVESFFKTLTQRGFQRLPSTTGGSAGSPKRRNAEKKAKVYDLTIDDARELLKRIIYDYNTGDHGSTHQSPLERMRFFHRGKNVLARQVASSKRSLNDLFEKVEKPFIRGGAGTSDPAHVSVQNVKYLSDRLSKHSSLTNTQIRITYDRRDMRTCDAYLLSGEHIGVLRARGHWGRIPHSYQTRKRVNQLNFLRKRDGLRPLQVNEYIEEIKQRTRTSVRARNELLRLEREAQEGQDRNVEDSANSSMGAKRSPSTRQPTLPKGLSDIPTLLPRTR